LSVRRHEFAYRRSWTFSLRKFLFQEALLPNVSPTFGDLFGIIVRLYNERISSKRAKADDEEIAKYVARESSISDLQPLLVVGPEEHDEIAGD
jgi:hypothetical protein